MTNSYDLFAATDTHLTRPKFRTTREGRFYPSEASVQIHDEHGDLVTHGGCLRSSYFRLSGEFEGTPHDARSEFIFAQGNFIEDMLIKLWKEMGIWVQNSVKFIDKENNISGELDAILAEPPSGQLYGVEVKSFYGYFAERELFGNKYQKPFPKMGQLLQTLIYLNHFETRLPFFLMAYFARDSVKRKTFKIELHHEGDMKFPIVDGEIIRTFTIGDIMDRYKLLQTHLDNKTVPPNDFELHFSDAKIEDFKPTKLGGKGKVAKTKYEAYKAGKLKKNEKIGDWQCDYCRYKETCWGK